MVRNTRPFALTLSLLCIFAWGRGDAAEPVDRHANPQARAVLNYLESLRGRSEKRLVSGQFAGFGSGASLRACEEAFKTTGHWPGIIGLDYAEFRNGGLEW